MSNIRFTKSFKRKAGKLCRKDIKLRQALKKQFNYFEKTQVHPSLKLHKLKGKRSIQYAVWILGDLRALCIKDNDLYIFFDLVTHDQY